MRAGVERIGAGSTCWVTGGQVMGDKPLLSVIDSKQRVDNTQSLVVCDMSTRHECEVLLPDWLKFLIYFLHAT
jgi:hypothetical protein